MQDNDNNLSVNRKKGYLEKIWSSGGNEQQKIFERRNSFKSKIFYHFLIADLYCMYVYWKCPVQLLQPSSSSRNTQMHTAQTLSFLILCWMMYMSVLRSSPRSWPSSTSD